MRRGLAVAMLACGVFVAVFVGLQLVTGAPPDVNPPTNTDSGTTPGTMQQGKMHVGTGQYVQASRLIGMEVRNDNQDKLGKIEDLAIDQNTGKVRYAVLSFGGLTGLGDKLLPMPWNALKTVSTAGTTAGTTLETYVLLNVDKDTLQKAPSFEKGQWPDFNNQKWLVAIDDFYRAVYRAATWRRHDALERDSATCRSTETR